MRKIILFITIMMVGTFVFANDNIDLIYENELNLGLELKEVNNSLYFFTPSPCEAGANAAYDAVIENGGTKIQTQAAYDASLKACEEGFKAME